MSCCWTSCWKRRQCRAAPRLAPEPWRRRRYRHEPALRRALLQAAQRCARQHRCVQRRSLRRAPRGQRRTRRKRPGHPARPRRARLLARRQSWRRGADVGGGGRAQEGAGGGPEAALLLELCQAPHEAAVFADEPRLGELRVHELEVLGNGVVHGVRGPARAVAAVAASAVAARVEGRVRLAGPDADALEKGPGAAARAAAARAAAARAAGGAARGGAAGRAARGAASRGGTRRRQDEGGASGNVSARRFPLFGAEDAISPFLTS